MALIAFAFAALGAFPVANAAVDIAFSDVPIETVNFDAVQYLNDEGVIDGYADGTYKPDSSINRAEFLKIVMEASGNEIAGGNCYPDVGEEWFAPYVCTATELGLVQGYPDGYYRPGQSINFAEASKIIVNTLDIDTEDIDSTLWFKHFVYALEDRMAIPETVSGFDAMIDRGEMAEMIYRLDAEVTNKLSTTFDEVSAGVPADEVGEELRSFRSCEALEIYLETDRYDYGYGIETEESVSFDTSDAILAPSGTAKSAAPVTTGGGGGSDDFSTTNVQVEGVDEADIVKTDGEYIYIVGSGTVRVVKAYKPSVMREVDSIAFTDEDFYPEDMYVDGERDRLVVMGYTYGDIVPYGVYAYPSYGSASRVYIYDISDPENVELIRETSFEGNYVSSRKVDDMVYIVLNRYNNYYYGDIRPLAEDLAPRFVDGDGDLEPLVGCGDIQYVPGGGVSNYLIVASVSVDDMDEEVDSEVVLGSSGDVYASRDNLYVAEPKYNWYYWDTDNESETVIHKFELNDGDVEYGGQGKVPGDILNQFSMDESDGYFRIATTKGNTWDEENPATNNMYVLDGDMNTVGTLEGLAPGESIYSVRFMGKRAYMVTFKKVDPLFVIDLSDPKNPNVLGKLKIPGFSDYLHPYDENHIIGFGKDTVEAEDENRDFAWYQGMKIAMFDVTDVANPKELHKVIIGDRGTDSELLWNHKALLFDKEKGIMSFPVTLAEIPQSVKDDPDTADYAYGDYTFQGAYVYDVSVANGFDLRGTITHYDDNEVAEKSGYYWSGINDIYRVLYIGNYFYTVSDGMVKASDMGDLEDVNSVVLEEEESYDNKYYWDDVVF